jgi:hypothetical protein
MSSSESTIRPAGPSRALVRRLAPFAVLAALVLPACTADYAKDGEAPVLLVMRSVNGGAPFDSDVRISSGSVCPDSVSVTLDALGKNPNIPLSNASDVVLERYEVRYFRSDGRATEGVDVPYSISGNTTAILVGGADVSVRIEVVRRQAKVEPPLSSLAENGFLITMFAEITVHGRTTAGQTTNAAVGRVQIDFADFGDSDTSCPTGQ